jgi:hypothetical protein
LLAPTIMSRIPGTLTEVRYRRVGQDKGHYFHRFTSPVRMIAKPGGAVLLKGRGKIWSDEDRDRNFARYTRRKRSQPMRRTSYRRNPSGSSGDGGSLVPLALIAGAVWLLSSRPGGISAMFAPRAPATYATNPDAVMAQAQASLLRTTVQGGTQLVSQTIANWFNYLRSGQMPGGVPIEVGAIPYSDAIAQANAAPTVGIAQDLIPDFTTVAATAGESAANVDAALAAAFTI